MTIFAELTPPYATIVADPPWPHKGSGNEVAAKAPTRVGRVVKDHRPQAKYSTLSLADMCALPVEGLAARNAHLYLWVTNSGLADGLAVMEAWGFCYKTAITWVKQGHLGLGAYFRTQTEHVLFGIRGSLPTLATDQRNVFEAYKQGHSVKPEAFMDIVERSSPPPYVELFCRRPRMGWDSWGKGYEVAS